MADRDFMNKTTNSVVGLLEVQHKKMVLLGNAIYHYMINNHINISS
jgi:hypothetical protein